VEQVDQPARAARAAGPDLPPDADPRNDVPTSPPDDPPGGPVAQVDALSITFRRAGRSIHALRGVSLDIAPGEILGLVGESGSGKSVLAMSLLGLLPEEPKPLTAGRVLVRGDDMLTGSAQLRRQVRRAHLGAVFQDPMTSLNPTMRIGRQLVEAAGTREEAVRLLRAVGMPEPERRLASYPHELSGGQRQRVMVAMAVAGRPSLVIADEPTTALDVTVQAQVLALLRSLRDEIGCSVLLVTHDLGVAAGVADRVAVLYAGRLAEIGPTPRVLRSAAHPYSLGLLRSRVSLDSDRARPLATLAGEVPNPAAPPPGCAFEPRCALAAPACTTIPPEPVEVSPGHASACILPPEQVRTAGLGEAGSAPLVPAQVTPATEPDTEPAAGVTPAVRIRKLSKSFPIKAGWRRRVPLVALRDTDLEVARGEAVAIVGESGSGKTTLLRAIAGLDAADHGQITFGPGARPQMVFQDAGASLTPWLTVGELIGERLRGQGMPAAARRERVAAALARVGLPAEVAAAKARQLSGGQRQRVALARATVIPPEVLLCDEPTSALDVSLAASVINLVGQLRRDLGMAVLFVTHDLSVARIVADRIAVMYLGRIVEIGDAETVVNRPRHPYTRALVAAFPDFETATGGPGAASGSPAAAGGEPASPLNPPPGCSFHPRCPVSEPACADPDLEPRLVAPVGAPDRRVACIRAEVI
jgi:peptide/nickel transport system ATP-binding protein